eukprot:365253-Chlamydomonas_euryale.AAC.30
MTAAGCARRLWSCWWRCWFVGGPFTKGEGKGGPGLERRLAQTHSARRSGRVAAGYHADACSPEAMVGFKRHAANQRECSAAAAAAAAVAVAVAALVGHSRRLLLTTGDLAYSHSSQSARPAARGAVIYSHSAPQREATSAQGR